MLQEDAWLKWIVKMTNERVLEIMKQRSSLWIATRRRDQLDEETWTIDLGDGECDEE